MLHIVVMALIAFGPLVHQVHANHMSPDEVTDLATERAIAWGASVPRVLGVLACETGRTFNPHVIGKAGELGGGQWLARGAWYGTKHFREWGIDVRAMYQEGHPDATFWDMDGLAWAFSPQAPPGFWRQWSCA